jgi:16S rRNA processing protein RimM
VAGSGKRARVVLGRIVGAHGVRGEVLVTTFTARPESIGAYGPLSDGSGERAFVLEVVRPARKGVVARLEGVADRTAAQALKGVELYVDRGRLPEAAEGEFYHADLVGLTAVDADGTLLGEVVAVRNYGAGDMLEIRLARTNEEALVPFTDVTVPEVDIAGRRVRVVLPPADDDA